jgi:hypothetical protein
MQSLKDIIAKSKSATVKKVRLPVADADVFVRRAAYKTIAALTAVQVTPESHASERAAWCAAMVQSSLCDEAGSLIAEDDDTIMDMDQQDFMEIFKACMDINGLSKEASEAVKKD